MTRARFNTPCDVYEGPSGLSPNSFVGTFDCRLVLADGIFLANIWSPNRVGWVTCVDYDFTDSFTYPGNTINIDSADRIAIPSGTDPQWYVLYTEVIDWGTQTEYFRANIVPLPPPPPPLVTLWGLGDVDTGILTYLVFDGYEVGGGSGSGGGVGVEVLQSITVGGGGWNMTIFGAYVFTALTPSNTTARLRVYSDNGSGGPLVSSSPILDVVLSVTYYYISGSCWLARADVGTPLNLPPGNYFFSFASIAAAGLGSFPEYLFNTSSNLVPNAWFYDPSNFEGFGTAPLTTLVRVGVGPQQTYAYTISGYQL